MAKGEYDTPGPGLSPRVRGNHEVGRNQKVKPGSIPARGGGTDHVLCWLALCRVYPRACGEPRTYALSYKRRRVYPRACGGTSCNQVLEFP